MQRSRKDEISKVEKILPINPKPFMHAYTHHGYFHAIASSADRVNTDDKDSVAEIVVPNFSQKEWLSEVCDLEYEQLENGQFKFYANKWNQNMNVAFYRSCNSQDRESVTIQKQIYSNAWSNISLFLAPKAKKDFTQFDSYELVGGNFAKDGIFYSNKKGNHRRINFEIGLPVSLTLIREQDKVYFTYENESFKSERILISKEGMVNESSEWVIGISVNLGDSIYYKWMFSNYIQMFSKPTGLIPIDYIINFHKDWCVHTANHLMDYNRITQSDVGRLGISLLDFVKAQLKIDNYVEIELNDNMKMNISDAENGPYFHQNLLYGFSDEKECFYALYYKNGNICQTEISYYDFESERNHREYQTIFMLKYNPCYEQYTYSVDRLLQVFKEYSRNENISYYDSFYDNYIVGENCYKQFTDIEILRQCAWDVRFAHLLYERVECNLGRIDFLHYYKYLDDAEAEKLTAVLKEEESLLVLARNTIVKGRMTGRTPYDKLQNVMQSAYDCDQKFTKEIIEWLDLKRNSRNEK